MADLSELGGIVPPLVTPFTEQGEVDTESLCRMVGYQVEAGVHGFFLLGSSGEFAALTDKQRVTVLETVAREAKGRVHLLAGVMDTCTDRCIEHGLAARRVGVDALVLTAPYYFSNSQAEILTHFRAVREAVGLPIVAYDIPSMVKVKLEVDTLVRLALDGTIIGVKDSSGNNTAFRELILATRGKVNLRIFTGSELFVDALLLSGAHGAVAGLANVAPHDYVRLYDAAMRGDWGEARRIQEALFTLARIGRVAQKAERSRMASAVGGYKTALMLKGVLATNAVGRPMLRYDEADVPKVRAILEEYEARSRSVGAAAPATT